MPCKQLLCVPVCQDTGWVHNVTHVCTHIHTLSWLQPLFSLVLASLFDLGFVKGTVRALSGIPAGAFGCCHKYKLIISALWFCRNQSCGYSTELRGRKVERNSHLSCLLLCVSVPPKPYQMA